MNRKQIKKLCKKYYEWWSQWLGLRWWRTSLIFVETWNSDMDAIAICDCKWQYMEAVVTVNLNMIADCNEEEIERVIVHELMHVFLNEMRESGIKHEERVAETLCKAFMWVRCQALEEVKR